MKLSNFIKIWIWQKQTNPTSWLPMPCTAQWRCSLSEGQVPWALVSTPMGPGFASQKEDGPVLAFSVNTPWQVPSNDALNAIWQSQPTQDKGLRGPGTPLGSPTPHEWNSTPWSSGNSYLNVSGCNIQTGLNMLAEIGPNLTWSCAWTHPVQREKSRHLSVEGHVQLRAGVWKQPWSVC